MNEIQDKLKPLFKEGKISALSANMIMCIFDNLSLIDLLQCCQITKKFRRVSLSISAFKKYINVIYYF